MSCMHEGMKRRGGGNARDKTFKDTIAGRAVCFARIAVHPQEDIDERGGRGRFLFEEIGELFHESCGVDGQCLVFARRVWQTTGGVDLPTFHNFMRRSRSALNFLAKRQLSSKTPMNRKRCSAGMVLYTSSFCSSSCVVSMRRSWRTHLTIICLKIRRWSVNERVAGRGAGAEAEAGGSGAGATNFWNGATRVTSQRRVSVCGVGVRSLALRQVS